MRQMPFILQSYKTDPVSLLKLLFNIKKKYNKYNYMSCS